MVEEVAAEIAEAFEILPGWADRGLVLICDHASNRLPEGYGWLGLAPDELERHIGYDIGAAAITRGLSRALGVPAVLSRFSRLLIDPNRGLDDPTLIMRLSDGAVVPGNRALDVAERQRRIERYYRPYHDAVSRVIAAALASGIRPAVFSVHSFTDRWHGVARPWHVGVPWDERDGRFAVPLIAALKREGDLLVGDNEPYRGGYAGDTIDRHARPHGLAAVVIEVRQDLIADETGAAAYTRRLERVLKGLLQSEDVRAVWRAEPATAGPGAAHGSSPTPVELEAQAFRRLLRQLRDRSDVQNIDLMNLAGFCRNCLANWYQEAAEGAGKALTKDQAREIIYGMPYAEWRERYQTEASAEQKERFGKRAAHQHGSGSG